MSDDWIPLINKWENKCILCGNIIEVGNKILWKKDSGIRHREDCTKDDPEIVTTTEDLQIIENDDGYDWGEKGMYHK